MNSIRTFVFHALDYIYRILIWLAIAGVVIYVVEQLKYEFNYYPHGRGGNDFSIFIIYFMTLPAVYGATVCRLIAWVVAIKKYKEFSKREIIQRWTLSLFIFGIAVMALLLIK